MTAFMLYATANEGDYSLDFLHFKQLNKFSSGVDVIKLVLVVSLVIEKTSKDEQFELAVRKFFSSTSSIKLDSVIFKSNVGRDFSSVALGLAHIKNTYGFHDSFILVRNRSAYGPFSNYWFSKFKDQLMKADIGMVGATLNFLEHPDIGKRVRPHVQTYVYMIKPCLLDKLLDDFPATNCEERLQLIDEGEIRLSERICSEGFKLLSLQFPEQKVGGNTPISDGRLVRDPRDYSSKLVFKHRNVVKYYPSFLELFLSKVRKKVSKIFR